jgi:hypothetical protein
MISIPHGAGEFTATCRDSGDGIRGRSLTAGLQALLTAGYVPIDDHVVPSGPRLTSWRRRAAWPGYPCAAGQCRERARHIADLGWQLGRVYFLAFLNPYGDNRTQPLPPGWPVSVTVAERMARLD